MTIAVILALCVSLILYLSIGFRFNRFVRGVADIMPVLLGRGARVATSSEFTAGTVSASISLATVLVAFYELVPIMGWWLVWTAITTALGLLAFALLAKRIWHKMASYDHRPTLHEFLGEEFDSRTVALFASLATSAGYLCAFSVELLVGGRFIAAMVPEIPDWITVGIIALVAFLYTSIGGFRVVVRTDVWAYRAILLLIAAMAVYFAWHVAQHGFGVSIASIPEAIRVPRWSMSLAPFLLGILVMNLFTFVGNFGLFQRVAGAQEPEVVTRGVWRSALQAGVTWSAFVVLAMCSFMIMTPVENENILVTTLKAMQGSLLGQVVIFCTTLGLLGALLSTASTQLSAVMQTLYTDVWGTFRKQTIHELADSPIEVRWSRLILVGSALLAVVIVELLRIAGYSVADMAFILYGAALGLVPPIIVVLFSERSVTHRLSIPATLAVVLGFVSCWSLATYGKVIGNGDLVFLSPVMSMAVASVVMGLGWMFMRLGTNRIAPPYG